MPSEPALVTRLVDCANAAGLQLSPMVAERMATYLALLARWNRRMNLTALPVDPPSPEAVERLILEPLAAATVIAGSPGRWLDVGSGGGSPAIPLHFAKPGGTLTMVESRARKAAFLREAVRSLSIERASVLQSRFEELPPAAVGSLDWITIRAVRPDQAFFDHAARLLGAGGRILLFGAAITESRGFSVDQVHDFPAVSSRLTVVSRA